MRIRSRRYSVREVNGVFFIIILSIFGFLIVRYTINLFFPSLYISSYSIPNVILAVIFGYFFQLSGSGLVGLLPYLPIARLIFIFGLERDLGTRVAFFQIGTFYFPLNLMIFLLFFYLSSSTATEWSLLFPQKEEYPPPLDSKRYYEWVTSPTHRINRTPLLKSIATRWFSFLFLLVLIVASIWEWKREIPRHLWYLVMFYFLAYVVFMWFSVLRAKATEKELDGHNIDNNLLNRGLLISLTLLVIVVASSIILPWGYSPFSLANLGNFLTRLFQPKPMDYGVPLVTPFFWRFRTLLLKPNTSLPPPREPLHIPSYILWSLLSIGVTAILAFLIKIGFFSKILYILKEGFTRLLYSIVEMAREFRPLNRIDTSLIRIPKVSLRERPTTLIGWIVYYYKVSLNLMAKKNLGKEIWETPYEYAKRIGSLRPDISNSYWELTEIFVTSRYKGITPKKDWISIMKNRIREVRERLR